MTDEHRHQPPLPWRLVASVLLLANALSIHYGCQMTMTNPSQATFVEFVNASYQRHWNISLSKEEVESKWSVIVSLLFVSSIGGSLALGLVGRYLRRKAAILVSCSITVLSHLIAIVSYFIGSHYVYALSRVIFGFCVVQANAFAGVFIVEVSSLHCRGRAFVFLPLFVRLGTVVGALIAVPSFLGSQERWWMMYAGEAVYASIAILIIALWMPETPTELVRLGLREKAQDSLRFYRAASEKQAETEYNQMAKEEADRLEVRGTGLWELWSARSSSQERRKLSADRRGALMGCVVLLAQVMSGICSNKHFFRWFPFESSPLVLNAYAVDMLSSGGVPIRLAEHSNVVLALLSMVGTFVSGTLAEKFGRRGLLLSTFASLIIANLLFVLFAHLSYETQTEFLSWAQVITLGCFMAIFSIAPGPVGWMVVNEMVSHESRPATQGSVGTVQAVLRSLQLAVFLPLKGKIGTSGAYGSLSLVPTALAIAYMYYFLPETRARTVEQVQTVAINQLPTLCKRKSPPPKARQTALTSGPKA